jgi:hypothetical protein
MIINVGFKVIDKIFVRIFFIRQMLEKKWEYSGIVNNRFVGFKKPLAGIFVNNHLILLERLN